MAVAFFTGEYQGIKGLITFTRKGRGVHVNVDIRSGLNDTTGKYPYHIHQFAINSTGSCASTGGHLDPTGVGVSGYVCDPNVPKKCEVGDLSGKYGGLQGSPRGCAKATYIDKFIALKDSSKAANGIIGRSIVIHAPNSPAPAPRIACADIVAK
ncbi:32342_t:CDS:2 [Racocetra persica]|uniref:32342_t:CDS:1 n=1 Tax=Racocetra persica TaxID=160502 RepID=A0ACA9KXB8_9GLOM|nr:32342_t:CDS:2 [Racocetra persica]